MLVPSQDRDPTRVLGVVVHPRFAGIAGVDRWGLAGRGLWITDLRRFPDAHARVQGLSHALARVMARIHPAHVVVSPGYSTSEATSRLVQAVCSSVSRMNSTLAVRDVHKAVRALVDKGPVGPFPLQRAIVRAFFPELDRFVRGHAKGSVLEENDRERYRRHAWHALALALHELALRHPRSCFALSRCNTGELYSHIASAERRRPTTV